MKNSPTSLAILCAMQSEVDNIVSQMRVDTQEKTPYGPVWTGDFFDRQVIIHLTGIGKVNAAAATQYAIHQYHPATVLNIGVAGGIAPQLSIGDVVVVDKTVQSDFDATAFGLQKGQIPDLDKHLFSSFLTKKTYLALKKKLSQLRLHFGTNVSADQFVTNRKTVLSIGKEFNAIAKDMELAAIAQVCHINRIPFASFKGISDSSGNDALEEYENSLQLAVENVSYVFTYFIQEFQKSNTI